MEELQLERTELSYITSINRSTRTFFAQLCKFSNEELINFNQAIADYCARVTEKPNSDDRKSAAKFYKGDVVCAKFPKDNNWYRALVLSRDKERDLCSVLFIDYGNLETICSKDLVPVNFSELPEMTRAPFGISCFLKDSEIYTPSQAEHLLDCLAQNYVMIRILERQTKLQWMVEIPKHAYNNPIWLIFKPELY